MSYCPSIIFISIRFHSTKCPGVDDKSYVQPRMRDQGKLDGVVASVGSKQLGISEWQQTFITVLKKKEQIKTQNLLSLEVAELQWPKIKPKI